MTERANPSNTRPAESFKTAGAIGYGGHSDGYVVPSASPTEISTQDANITEGNLSAFGETSTGSSLDVDIDGGEAFVFGSWLAIDTTTTVTLAASTADQTVYVGWNKDGSDDVIVGLDSAFASASGDTDMKIPLWDFTTDGSGVTSTTDRRTLGKTIEGAVQYTSSSQNGAYTTAGEGVIFVDSSGGAVTITVSNRDIEDDGREISIIDSGGSAGTNNITIDTQGSQTIDGVSSIDISTDYGATRLTSDGTNLFTSGGGASTKIEQVVDSPTPVPVALLQDTEVIKHAVPVPDGETLKIYRWGAYKISDSTAPAGLTVELRDDAGTAQSSENTVNTENTATPVASYTNSSGSLSIFKLAVNNTTGNDYTTSGVGGHFGYVIE